MFRGYLLPGKGKTHELIFVNKERNANFEIYYVIFSREGVGTGKLEKIVPMPCRHPDNALAKKNYDNPADSPYYITMVADDASFSSHQTAASLPAFTKLYVSMNEPGQIYLQRCEGSGVLREYSGPIGLPLIWELSRDQITGLISGSSPTEAVNRAPTKPLVSSQQSGTRVSGEPNQQLTQFKSSIEEIISKLDKRSVWNGRKKAQMIRDALAKVDDNDNVEAAFSKVQGALSWQRWFTLFQTNRSAPKNSLKVMHDLGYGNPHHRR